MPTITTDVAEIAIKEHLNSLASALEHSVHGAAWTLLVEDTAVCYARFVPPCLQTTIDQILRARANAMPKRPYLFY